METTQRSYSVLVSDLFHSYEPDCEMLIEGFASFEEAVEYARRRVRDSIEELRAPGQTPEALYLHWRAFGEDAYVYSEKGSYRASAEIDTFIANPATAEERDWLRLSPKRK